MKLKQKDLYKVIPLNFYISFYCFSQVAVAEVLLGFLAKVKYNCFPEKKIYIFHFHRIRGLILLEKTEIQRELCWSLLVFLSSMPCFSLTLHCISRA